MSTEALTVFVDHKLNKLVDYYSYQIIRRIIFNHKSSKSTNYIKDRIVKKESKILTSFFVEKKRFRNFQKIFGIFFPVQFPKKLSANGQIWPEIVKMGN